MSIFICRELGAKVLNMFKKFMQTFSPKYFARPKYFHRRSCECGKPVTAKFWQIYNAKFSRHSYECRRASVVQWSRNSLEKTCENLATIWRENKTKRHSYECRATLSQMPRDCHTNENKLHSWESRGTLSRMSCDYHATVAGHSRDISSK